MKKHLIATRVFALFLAVCMSGTTLMATPASVYAQTSADSVAASSPAVVEPGTPEEAKDEIGGSATAEPDAVSPSEQPAQPSEQPAAGSESESTENDADSEAAEPTETPEATPAPEETPAPQEDADEQDAEAGAEGDKEAGEEVVGPLAIVNDGQSGEVEAKAGDELTFSVALTRDDVSVTYQWEKYVPSEVIVAEDVTPIKDYDEDDTTWYRFLLADMSESELLAMNPDARWDGIEMYVAIKDALEEAGLPADSVSVANKTPNYALEGYVFTAEADGNGNPVVYAQKEDTQYIGTLNEDGKWTFADDAGEQKAVTDDWVPILDATEPDYTFTVAKEDFRNTYRCVVTITDEEYLAARLAELEEQGIEVAEEDQEAEQQLISKVMSLINTEPEEESDSADEPATIAEPGIMPIAGMPAPELVTTGLEKNQWVKNLNGDYEYITKDAYDRAKALFDAGTIDQTQFDRFWTKLNTRGWNGTAEANVLDDNGVPTGETRLYQGFNLTDGKLEVNSEWYGKTVYFRKTGNTGTGTAIEIPAYTELSTDENGDYISSNAGTRYKKAVMFLNAYVNGAGKVYEGYLDMITDSNGYLQLGGESEGIHINTISVPCEDFNRDPTRYMVDAEGNYRFDSVGWGVCVGPEPDLSGKSYYALTDFIANGYGLIIGHDTLYDYAGTYPDATMGRTFDPATIDPNDGETWYYIINSWTDSGTVASNPDETEFSNERGGPFYMNQLVGTNKGNVEAPGMTLSDSPSLIFSTGGSHSANNGKKAMYGGKLLHIAETGGTAAEAKANPKYRSPTNYPYSFDKGLTFQAAETHSNQQAAFGTIWVDYGENTLLEKTYGRQPARYWDIDGRTGTNNFYLSGDGNFLMNQVGHIGVEGISPELQKDDNYASIDEFKLFANSVMYVSQRKQCEICAADQQGQQTAHFVRRINSVNASSVLNALRNGGTFWYPLDGCYVLTEDITLPEDWTTIEGFNGHWDSDVYTVTLNSKRTPLLAVDSDDGESGWNYGTDRKIGTQNVFVEDMNRTTGVARVVGNLNDLFGTNTNYLGYRVEIRGEDNPKYMEPDELYDCEVNSDSKYVISGLPCIYNDNDKTGILKARVYDRNGRQVEQYGYIYVDVDYNFWTDDMTTPLRLGGFDPDPVNNYHTLESGQAIFKAVSTSSEAFTLKQWEYRNPAVSGDPWKKVEDSWDKTINTVVTEPGDKITDTDVYVVSSTLTLNDVDPRWNGYEFRAVFESPEYGTWNTYLYYWYGAKASNTQFSNAREEIVFKDGYAGLLLVDTWPAFATSGADKDVYESESATFTATGLALADSKTKISVEWEYGTKTGTYAGEDVFDWKPVVEGPPVTDGHPDVNREFGGIEKITTTTFGVNVEDADGGNKKEQIINVLRETAGTNDETKFWQKATFYTVKTSLTVNKVDISQSGYRFRVHFTATTKYGTKYDWYSDIANDLNGAWTTYNKLFGYYPYQPVDNHSNELTVRSPEIRIITEKSAAFAEGKNNEDLLTPDEYGQTLFLQNVAAKTTNSTAAYKATVYYKPSSMTPQPQWQYQTITDHAALPWDQSVGRAFENNLLRQGGSSQTSSLNVNVSLSNPTNATYGGETGWTAVSDIMKVSSATPALYNPESLVKLYFRCLGVINYQTVRGDKQIAATDKWGGLTIDYQVALWHNGVIGYDGKNIINGKTVTDVDGLQAATKTTNPYSTWYFPNLSIHLPVNHHANTLVIYLEDTPEHDNRGNIAINTTALNALGIDVVENTKTHVTLISRTMNSVSTANWEKALREDVWFNTYDTNVNYSVESVKNDTCGGLPVKWIIDENRMAGTKFDPSTGHLYKVVAFTGSGPNDANAWDTAKVNAAGYDSEYGMAGYLAEINDAAENEFIKGILGGKTAWLGGHNTAYNTGITWTWDKNKNAMSYTNWDTSIKNYNKYKGLYINPTTGKWASGPSVEGSKVSYSDNYNFGSTSASGEFSGDHDTMSGNDHHTGAVSVRSEVVNARPTATIRVNSSTDDRVADTFWWLEGNVNGSWRVITPDGGVSSNPRGNWYAAMDGGGTYSIALPAGTTQIRLACRNDATAINKWVSVSGSVTVAVTVDTTVIKNDCNAYVVEYEPQGFALAVTDHSATDTARIGTQVDTHFEENSKSVVAIINGASKVYDGTQIVPSAFTVTGSAGADRSLFEITYTAPQPDNHADYAERTVSGSAYQNTGAVNATRYHAVVKLTDAAIAAGWVLDEPLCSLECDLVIYQRPVNVFSYGNNKVYDKTSDGVVKNIKVEARNDTNKSGVIAGDVVNLNTTTVPAFYLDSHNLATVHNSKTNNVGTPNNAKAHNTDNEYTMQRIVDEEDETSGLYIVHDDVSDPHYNYVLQNEDFTGAILQRGLVVHSRYLKEADGQIRNVKEYDGDADAVISDILIDNIIMGDRIGLEETVLFGTYESKDAGEEMTGDHELQEDRFRKLKEYKITPNKGAVLSGNTYGDYYIEREEYTGAIARAMIEVRPKTRRFMYGSETVEAPWYVKQYDKNSLGVEGWLGITGLVAGDVLNLDDSDGLVFGVFDKEGNEVKIDKTVDVGIYPLTVDGLHDGNYPVLKNYYASYYDGLVEIYPREIVVTAEDVDWYINDDEIPKTHSRFEMLNDDEETYSALGSDSETAYGKMTLVNGDTIESVLRIVGSKATVPDMSDSTGKLEKNSTKSLKEFGSDSGDTRNTTFNNGSNTDYNTFWYPHAPVIYLDIENDQKPDRCEWCENYHGFEIGTDHWPVFGYELRVNQSKATGNTMEVATTVNPLGNKVKNYSVTFVSGLLRVHPLRFQLRATVPMQICMYGYAGDGEVVEPENYGITNYSNGSIQVTDIDVSDDGWSIVKKDPIDLKAGEMSMNFFGTPLQMGNNKPLNQERWVIAGDSTDDKSGTFLHIPLTCYIAGGNVNGRQESFVTKVTYTVAEYGYTIPDLPGVDWPSDINGRQPTVETYQPDVPKDHSADTE